MQDSKNEDLNDLIREFSFQILQEPISISANDFFGIEYQLLSSMAAASITFLVVLVQFEISTNTPPSISSP